MIEITAKQLYDIYKGLPDSSVWESKYRYMPYKVAVMRNVDAISLRTCTDPIRTFSVHEIEFRIDIESYPFEWKPTTDLIIKA